MTWEKSTSRGIPIVKWVGPEPEFVYHFTSRAALRKIRKEKLLRVAEAGRGGFSSAGAMEGGVSFTDDVSSFISKHGFVMSRYLRVRTDAIPAIAPVIYVGGSTPTRQHVEMQRLQEEGFETRSLFFVKEEEWWTPESVPLTEGNYSIALPLTTDMERSL
jgi:hypothetical protein